MTFYDTRVRELIVVDFAAFTRLQDEAFDAGVPLRVIMKPLHAVERLKYMHKRAREPMYGTQIGRPRDRT